MDVLTQARLDYLQGQVTALQTAVRALVCAHPEPANAARIVDLMLEESNAMALISESEPELMGLEAARAKLLPIKG